MGFFFLPCAVALSCLSVSVKAGILCYNCAIVPHQRDCDTVLECGDHEMCYGERIVTDDGITTFRSGCKPKHACVAISSPVVAFGKRSSTTVCSKCCDTSNCNAELCDEHVPKSFGQRCLFCEYVLKPKDCFVSVQCDVSEVCYTQSIIHNHERRYRLGCAKAKDCGNAIATPVGRRETQTANYCGQCCSSENCNRDLCYNASVSHVSLNYPPPLKYCRDNSTEICSTQAYRCNEDYFKFYLCPYTCGQCGAHVVDVCSYNPCGSHGICIAEINGYTCKCSTGFTGAHCEKDVCAFNHCGPHGQCIREISRYTCKCTAGYIGPHCETAAIQVIDPCANDPCGTHGHCVRGLNSYTCRCSAGYTGVHCEIGVTSTQTPDNNPCASNPCLHGGTCENHGGRFKCNCEDFYRGTICENECASSHNFIWNGHCYLITHNERDWHTGLCGSQFYSMTQAVIDSPGENSALASFLAKRNLANQMVWIGAHQLHKHHHWVWNDYKGHTVRLDPDLWLSDPNSAGHDHCMGIQEGKWESSPCNERHLHLCERPLLGNTTTTAKMGVCVEGHVCYTLVKSSAPWSQRICHPKGLRLATITTAHKHNVMMNFIRNENNYQGLVWLGGRMDHGELRWDRDQHNPLVNMTTSVWKQPPGDGDCVALDGDKLCRMSCNQEYYHLCENRF